MVHKDGNQWVEEVFFQVVEKTGGVVQKFSVWDERIGTRLSGILLIEALASRSDRAVNGVSVVTDTSSSAVERTEEVGTRLAESRTN